MILVLGASGHTGALLVEELTARGARFRAGYRAPQRIESARREGLDAVRVDYTDPASLDAALAGMEKVFLVAPPTPDLERLERAVVEAAQRAGTGHLVKVSVWDARTGDFIFARPHRVIEDLVQRSGIPWTFLRPNDFMQNLLASAPLIRSTGIHAYPDGGRVSTIHVGDIARVAAVVLTGSGHEGQAYDLSGPEALTYEDRIRILSEVTGRRLTYVAPSDEEWRQAALGHGLPEFLVDALINLQRYMRSGAGERVTPTVEEITGRPATSYRQFAEENAAAFR